MRKFLLLIMLFAGLAGFKQDKSRCISGTVYGSDGQLPLRGATVIIKGTTRSTLTDANGHYKINVFDSDTQLVFRWIGYKPQIITIGKKDTIVTIYLIPESFRLDVADFVTYSTCEKMIINKSDTMKKYTIPKGK